MIKEYLHVSKSSSQSETVELERLAGQLSLSETPQQVCHYLPMEEEKGGKLRGEKGSEDRGGREESEFFALSLSG